MRLQRLRTGCKNFPAAGDKAGLDPVQIRAFGVDDVHLGRFRQRPGQPRVVILGRVQGVEDADAQALFHAASRCDRTVWMNRIALPEKWSWISCWVSPSISATWRSWRNCS